MQKCNVLFSFKIQNTNDKSQGSIYFFRFCNIMDSSLVMSVLSVAYSSLYIVASSLYIYILQPTFLVFTFLILFLTNLWSHNFQSYWKNEFAIFSCSWFKYLHYHIPQYTSSTKVFLKLF